MLSITENMRVYSVENNICGTIVRVGTPDVDGYRYILHLDADLEEEVADIKAGDPVTVTFKFQEVK